MTIFQSYDDIRSSIQDGDIIFIRGDRTLGAKLVKFFTRSNYSHVAIAFWANMGNETRLMVVESQGGTKNRIINMSYYSEVDFDVVTSPKSWNSVVDVALARIGILQYSWMEAIYVGLRESLLKYWGIKIPVMSFSGEICSEFVARVYGAAEIHVSPQLLWEELEAQGQTIRVEVRNP